MFRKGSLFFIGLMLSLTVMAASCAIVFIGDDEGNVSAIQTDAEEFDLSYGDVTISYVAGDDPITVSYTDGGGEAQSASFADGTTILIKQTDNGEPKGNVIRITGFDEENPLDLVISGLNISLTSDISAISMEDSFVNMMLDGMNAISVTVSEELDSAAIRTSGTSKLTIGTVEGASGDTNLNVTMYADAFGINAAAIGGNDGEAGNIVIEGGTVTVDMHATYGIYGAGIGGGHDADGNVTINGGMVALTMTSTGIDGYIDGAGIGGGSSGIGSVEINGGTVTVDVTSAYGIYGAGIGGGYGNHGNVTITNGNLTVDMTITDESIEGAGIGGGMNAANPSVIKVEGGTVRVNLDATAGGCISGAGIGGGGGSEGDVTINDGNVTVAMEVGEDTISSAGIGGDVATVRIEGGNVTVDVTSAFEIYGAGIGSSAYAAETTAVTITGGNVTVNMKMTGDVGDLFGAAIGGGCAGDGATNVTVNGGTVNVNMEATGEDGDIGAAGIGDGYDGYGPTTIVIGGGTVTVDILATGTNGDLFGPGIGGFDGSTVLVMTGGSVKVTMTGNGVPKTDALVMNPMDSDDGGNDIFPVTLKMEGKVSEDSGISETKVNGTPWSIFSFHPDDMNLYLYLPSNADGETHSVTVDIAGTIVECSFTIFSDGTVGDIGYSIVEPDEGNGDWLLYGGIIAVVVAAFFLFRFGRT